MPDETLHVHHHHPTSDHHKRLLLFLIPSIAFAMTLATFAHYRNKAQVMNTHEQEETYVAPILETKVVTVGNTQINAFVAQTQAEQATGLGNRAMLGENEGMLFPFSGPTTTARFWMKNMQFPLDFIWMLDGKVVQIHENVAAPTDDQPDHEIPLIIPNGTVDGVLEVNAGVVKEKGIKTGDSISW